MNNNLAKIDQFKGVLNSQTIRAQLKNSLKDKAGQFMSSMIDLYSGETALQNCDPEKVALECVKAAALDLPLVKSLGYAYVVPKMCRPLRSDTRASYSLRSAQGNIRSSTPIWYTKASFAALINSPASRMFRANAYPIPWSVILRILSCSTVMSMFITCPSRTWRHMRAIIRRAITPIRALGKKSLTKWR